MPAPAFELGVDPVHFGLGIVLNLTIGAVTPPVGTILSSVCASVELSIGLAPFLLAPHLRALVGPCGPPTVHGRLSRMMGK